MKLTAFYKDIWREIFRTVGRFVFIFLIVAIGCGFFAVIKATMPYMKGTAARKRENVFSRTYYEPRAFAARDITAISVSESARKFRERNGNQYETRYGRTAKRGKEYTF